MPNIGQNVLYVLSARQRMSWSAFKGVFDELVFNVAVLEGWSLDEVKRLRSSLVRGLQSLGHIELFEQDAGLVVTMAPPTLVRLPVAGRATAILSGWRSPSMLRQLMEIALDKTLGVEFREEQATSNTDMSPSRWVVTSGSEAQLLAVASRLGIEAALNPAASALGAMAPSLAEYLASLEWGPLRPIPPGSSSFDCSALRFVSDHRRDALTGLWAIPVPTSVRRRFVMRLGERQAFVHMDYGRWALVAHTGNAMAFYDARSFSLSAPAQLSLPVPIARAAALCSGRIPRLVNANHAADRRPHALQLEYSDVPPLLGRQLLMKLTLPAAFRLPTTPAGA